MVTPQAVSQSASGNFMVQVGAVSDQARAQQYQQQLGQKFGVPGRVTQNGAVWRIQLGPFYLLHAFMKKTQKTPTKAIEIARMRLKEMK